jgi:signal transduction histidine kinase
VKKEHAVMAPLLVHRIPLLAFLQEQVLPPVIQHRASSTERLRIWSIGCRGGDEASTLALLVQSLLAADSAERSITLFATDADPAAISRARSYRYPARLLPHLPEAALPLLEADPSEYRLHPSLRRQILFGPHALLSQMPFPHLDLILCHDSFADFAPVQQQILFNRLAYALSPLGYLLLISPAASEPDPAYYQRLEGAWPLYQRTAIAVTVHSLGWGKAEGQGGASPLAQDPLREHDEIRDAYVEELQTALEDREMASQEVNQRFQELEQAYQDLEQIQLLKDDFLSLMSHEMRTPLTVLLATAQLLQRGPVRAKPKGTEDGDLAFQERFAKRLETIEHQAQQISRLLAELLDAARLHSDMFHLSPSSMDLVKLVGEIITHQELLTARRVRLVTALETIVGIWDGTRLEQVVRNLLTNALKYSEPSTEIVMTLRYRFVAGQAREVLIAVQDQGRGISEEGLPHVFDRFYRADKQRDDPQARESLGLGLYITAEIVKRHGGRIWAESQLGGGSTFFVALPLRMPAMGFPPVAADGMAMQKASG